MNENHNFLSLLELKEKFNLVTPFTLHYELIKAIHAKRKINSQQQRKCRSGFLKVPSEPR